MIRTLTSKIAIALSLFGACVSFGADWHWKDAVKENTPFSEYDFSSPANWSEESGYPSTTADSAIFTRATRYVRLPDGLSINGILASGSLLLLCNGQISLSFLNYQSYTYPVQTVLAEQINAVGDGLRVSVSDVAADLDLKGGSLTCGGDYAGFRWDLYANSADEVRVNPIKNLSKVVMGSGGSPRFFAPRGAAEQKTTWRLVGGSPYAELVGSAVAIAPGARVTGGGFSQGAFVRRKISDKYIELSETADDDAQSVELTFSAYDPIFSQVIPTLQINNTAIGTIGFGKYRETDQAEMDIESLIVESSKFKGFQSPTDFAGRLILHNIDVAKEMSFYLKNVDIEFGARTDGGTPGFPGNVTVYQTSSSDKAVFTVAAGLEAAIPSFTNVIGSVTKQGAGILGMSIGDTATMQELVVEDGTLVLGDKDITVKDLTVKAGATLKTKGTVRVTGTKTVESGATVEGDVVTLVRNSYSGGPLVLGRPANVITMPGNPAFWVNTDNVDTDFEFEVEGGVTNVTRWNDCRGSAAAGYNFATNYMLRPQLKSFPVGVSANVSGSTVSSAVALEIARTGSAANDHGLLWGRSEKVRSLFLVMNPGQQVVYDNDGGGCLLGSTRQPNPWGRSNKPLFESSFVASAIKNGDICVNGEAVSWDFQLGNAFSRTTNGEELPVIIEVHTKDDGVLANAFGVNGTRYDLAGGQRIFECVVYTNELTYLERMQACEYLGAKWMGAGANSRYVKDGNRVASAVADGSEREVDSGAVDIEKLAGSGTFVKSGSGEMLIEDCVVPAARVFAREGRLVVKSYLPNRDALPYDSSVHLHIDADDADSITFKDIAEKGKCVSAMESVRGDASVKATALSNSPLLRYSEGGAGEILSGKPYVDMGDFRVGTNYGSDTIDDGSAEILTFTASHQIRSIFMVMGTHRGGGNPIGWKAKWENYWNAGLDRWHAEPSKLAVASTPICSAAGASVPRTARNASYGVTRLNGEQVTPSTTGYSGKFDIVSHVFRCDRVSTSAFACEHYNNWVGGLELSEAILSTRWHSAEETKLVEAYLRRKWFGQGTEGFRQAEIGTLEIGSGATVEVLGDAPIKVGKIVGSGTLNCAVDFMDGVKLSVKVDNGTIEPVILTNATGFENGGVITVDGPASALQPGQYALLLSDGVKVGQQWSVDGSALGGRCVYTAVVRDGAVLLQVVKRGLVLIVR